MSTRDLAAGWTTSSNFRIVAPSLEIVALPEHIKNILVSMNSSCDERLIWLSILVKVSVLTSVIHNQFVHPPGPQGGSDCLSNHLAKKKNKNKNIYLHTYGTQMNCKQLRMKNHFSDLACIDVTDELGNTLRRVRPLLQQDNRCGLERVKNAQAWGVKECLTKKISDTK